MTEKAEFDLDGALAELASDVRDGGPRPGPELIARVLADAADVNAARLVPVKVENHVAAPRWRLGDLIFGWTSGALAAFALCLVLGIGVGLGLEPGDMPLFDAPDDAFALAMDAGPFSDEIL